MNRHVHALFVPLVFPAGIAPGEGGDYNLLTIARNGTDEPVLRGSALAGALRHAWRKHQQQSRTDQALEEAVNFFFGYPPNNDDPRGQPSRLLVSDCVLHTGSAHGDTVTRTYHLRNRHHGTTADGGLFSLEACPPGTRTTVAFWLLDDNKTPQTSNASREFIDTIVEWFATGLTLGGKAARGLGMARLADHPTYRLYDLSNTQEHAAWLDDHRAWRSNPLKIPTGQTVSPKNDAGTKILHVHFTLGIPRGQDIVIGDGQGLDHAMEPQRVRAFDGREYWRLPGASLRGLFRSWVARLAAREGQPVADNVRQQQGILSGEYKDEESLYKLTGENLGWCFLPKAQRRHGQAKTDCPVASLFGSLFQAGRIQIADAYAQCRRAVEGDAPPEEQLRKHVAVDRVTGGAAEGMLFENTVLTAYANGMSPTFSVTMRVQSPTESEARWLADTLRALDLGLLRVGASKSSGRLALIKQPQASGPCAEFFTKIEPVNRAEMFSFSSVEEKKSVTEQESE